MKISLVLIAIATMAMSLVPDARAQETPRPYIRLAELTVDTGRLAEFNAAAQTHIRAATNSEPGILAFHVVAQRGRPAQIRVLEMYVDESAYRAHLQTAHYKAFATATQVLLTSTKLIEAVPVRLGAKAALPSAPVVRVADLEIIPARLDAYVAAVTEEIDESIQVEPGVAAIYAMARKDDATQLRFFEIYADEAAYRRHIDSPHFRKYVETTKEMIKSRELYEMESPRLYIKAR